MSNPVRLSSNSEKLTVSEKIDNWALAHRTIILTFCFVAGGILVTILAYHIVGVSATESGMLRNFLARGGI